MSPKWLDAVKNYKATWPYMIFAALVISASVAAGLAIGGLVTFLVELVLPEKVASPFQVPGLRSGDIGGGLAIAAGCAVGVVVTLIVGSVLYRIGLPHARKYAQIASVRASEAAANATQRAAARTTAPIGYTTDGQPIYPIVGYTPGGQPVTADRAVGVQSQAAGTNGLAIASLITAFIFPIIGAILGFIARSQIKKTGQDGGGLALAGIIIGGIFTAINILAVILFLALAQGTF